MTKLKKFGGKYKDETVERIARYFGFSAGLHFGTDKPDESRMKAAKKTLKEWTHGNGELFVIVDEKDTVGFVHINYRTGNTAWIEDIYVDELRRGQGIATRVIGLAEDKINPTGAILRFVSRLRQIIKPRSHSIISSVISRSA